MPRSTRVHLEEVTKQRRLLTAEQRRDPTYVTDSPNWEVWFAMEHEQQRRRGVRQVQPGGPPPPVVNDEDQEAEAAYQAALAGVLRDSEEEARRAAEEEEAYRRQLAEAMALSAAGYCVVPPPPEPEPYPEPALPGQVYQWTGVVQEFLSPPPIWLGATPEQEQAYLEHWRSVHLQAERAEGLRLMELEKEEEEERARTAALPPPQPQPTPAGQTTEAQAAALWNSAFPWAGPAPTLVDLTGPDDDEDV
ncbi:hypothetical protein D1007_58443 [Hordeum vulgare]|nr:hypothetical protein D1007_58443 [Hordeum vulgare]